MLLIIFLFTRIDAYAQFDYSGFDLILQNVVIGNRVNYSRLLENKNIEEPHLLDYIKLYYNGQIDENLYTMDIEY